VTDRSIDILLVEDDPGDVVLAREALQEGEIKCELNVAEDGDAALAYLRRQGDYADATRPDIILLDLNLPKRDGLEILAEIKEDAELRAIPVVVLTTSSYPEHVLSAYDLQASFYITKPTDLDQFIATMQQIKEFSAGVAQLPPRR